MTKAAKHLKISESLKSSKAHKDAIERKRVRKEQLFRESLPEGVTMTGPYVSAKTVTQFNCAKHGPFEMAPKSIHDRTYPCRGCFHDADAAGLVHRGDRKAATDKACATKLNRYVPSAAGIESLRNHLPERVSFEDSDYINNKTKMMFTCSEHGVFVTTPVRLKSYKYGCPQCSVLYGNYRDAAKNSVRAKKAVITKMNSSGGIKAITDKSVSTRIANRIAHFTSDQLSVWNDVGQLQDLYNRGNVNTIAEHFGVTRDIVLGHFNRIGVVIHYNYSTSQGERELTEFIQSIYNGAVITSDRSTLSGKELGVLLPDINTAFEYNCVYYHSDQVVDKQYHHNKWKACCDAGIRLIQIWEDDWENNNDVVKKFVENTLKQNSTRLNARDGVIALVDNKAANMLVNELHMQGGRRSYSFCMGLTIDERLVSVMGWQLRSGGEIELVRFVNNGARGAFSRLLKHSVGHIRSKYQNVDTLTSFADMEIVGTANVYTKHGFVEKYRIPPDYKYVDRGIRRHKSLYRKEAFVRMGIDVVGKVESQLAEDMGLSRVFDSGKIKYTKPLFDQLN